MESSEIDNQLNIKSAETSLEAILQIYEDSKNSESSRRVNNFITNNLPDKELFTILKPCHCAFDEYRDSIDY